jgi:hypothetical protein
MYFLENSAVLSVALFFETLAFKTEGHLASPLKPGQTCAARCRQIFINIQFRNKIADITKVTAYSVEGYDHKCIVAGYCRDLIKLDTTNADSFGH